MRRAQPRISQIDLNPVIITKGAPVAVDASLILAAAQPQQIHDP
jgi:hypothetical protein